MPDWYHSTTDDLLQYLSATLPNKTAVIHHDRRVTYADVTARVQRLAAGLARPGITHGMRVAVWLPNRPKWIEVQFALRCLGAIMVPWHTRFQADEMARIGRHCEAEALVLQKRFINRAYMEMLNALYPNWPAVRWGSLQAECLPDLRHAFGWPIEPSRGVSRM
jgi:non-ribosomal peptide synthetase component E (peptide arylation enzyme)